MNRCIPRRLGIAFLLAACATPPASAQTGAEVKPAVRNFPAAALRGEMVVLAPPAITLDGRAERLTPGARIRDTHNLLVLSGALVNQPLVVNYLREGQGSGNIHEVWILNAEEIRQKRPNTRASWFSLDSGTPTGSAAGATAP